MNREIYKKQIKTILSSRPKSYIDYLKDNLKSPKMIIIFGMGNLGRSLYRELELLNLKVEYFCDSNYNKVGTQYKGVLCISLEELLKKSGEIVILIASRQYKEIFKTLTTFGKDNIFRVLENKRLIDEFLDKSNLNEIEKKINQVIDILEDEKSCCVLERLIQEWCRNEYSYGQFDDIYTSDQYFDRDIFSCCLDKEIFVDCGAYVGDTLEQFIRFAEGKFEKCYLFELSKKNYNKLCNNIEHEFKDINSKIVAVNKGITDKTREILYDEFEEGSGINTCGNIKGTTISIDEYFENKKVTFIKMDIEGNELAALRGAKHIITANKPKLAICIYHKPDDFWTIPLYIKQILPEYRIYIRHHTDILKETVCYAVPNIE